MFLTSLFESLGYTHKREAVKHRRRPLAIDVLEDRRLLATWTVDDGFATGCTAQRKCGEIQAAVTAASAGDTIKVLPGTYEESVTVDKKLTIQGSQGDTSEAQKHPANPIKNATIVEITGGQDGFHLAANDIVIRGFTIQDSDMSEPQSVGVEIDRATSGDTIDQNIIQNTTFGMYVNTNGVHKTTVQNNLIRNNNNPGASSGNGIYSDQGASNVAIQKNYFTGNLNTAMLFVDTGAASETKSNLTIKDNTLDHDGSMAFTNGTGIHVVNNTSNSSIRSGVFFGGGVTNSEVSNNKLTTGGTTGVYLVTNAFGNAPDANSNIQIANNKISGFVDAGIRVTGGANHVTVKNNDVKQNGTAGGGLGGITLEDAGTSMNQVLNNHVESNVEAGILLNGSSGNTVSNNDVKKNGGGGISLQGDSANKVLNNHLDSNTGVGILLNGSTGDTVSKNDVKKSSGDGISLVGATGNTVDHNNAESNGTPASGAIPATGDGIHADAASTGNTFDQNDAKKNALYDYQDESVGAGTAGTANTWTKNKGKTASPPGLIN